MKSGDIVIKSLNEMADGNSEIVKETLSMIKKVDIRLSALDITVQYIKKNRLATDSEKAFFLELIDNLQEQVDVITKDIDSILASEKITKEKWKEIVQKMESFNKEK
tara:strand:+ start:1931 stop:2251 length:321 start_codon:yes stop_codon:yes gene_type:complete